MVINSKREALYHLAFIDCEKEYRPEDLRRVIAESRRSLESFWTGEFGKKKLEKIPPLREKNVGFVRAIQVINDTNFEAMRINEIKFPAELKVKECSSYMVYVRGDKELLNGPTICFHGPVKAKEQFIDKDAGHNWEEYVQNIKDSAAELVKNGFTVAANVYGDTHQIALNKAMRCGGRVVGIIKGGLDVRVRNGPESRILDSGGLLISDMPIGMQYIFNDFWTFNDARNRSNFEMHLPKEGSERYFISDAGNFSSKFYPKNGKSYDDLDSDW